MFFNVATILLLIVFYGCFMFPVVATWWWLNVFQCFSVFVFVATLLLLYVVELKKGLTNMSIISVVSPKGGAGKSTLAVTMATMFARLNVNVCVVDADPQQTVSHWYYGSNQNDEIKTSHKIHVIKNVKPQIIIQSLSSTHLVART